MADQNVTFYIFAKDEASGKFRNAANDITQSMQKVGIATSKVGKGVAFDMDKMAASHDKAGRAARYQGRIISELQAKIGSLRNILLLYFFAMRPIMKEINAITTAAIAQENAERKLAAAFAATGRGTKENIKTLVDYASQLQSTTGISDDAIISAQAYLANFRLNEKQIKLATTAV